ncbi:hypothetical protein FHW69_000042 [Luteibacter sp. Sphag1AF]|uniref:hypothetical protein n=1 Tax=Luteibacter sp. Sphag1AF TaxID=2587031 RepID=UPI00160B5411|nr:hypothetical protein [Luteibacter sp. Sphag1AF]MBB3225452.1 hypothetical protein [Luteibacter sp. Sphag1AF]
MKAFLLALVLGLAPAAACAGDITVLSASDVKALTAPPARGERVIALWALDCAYCEENLSALAKLAHDHADMELVSVATDSISQRELIRARLANAGLSTLTARAYADATPERINFLIDPGWGGETPRTLVIRADGSRMGISGLLNAAALSRIATP